MIQKSDLATRVEAISNKKAIFLRLQSEVDKRRRELLETLRAYMEERERQKAELRKMSESEWDMIMQKARKNQKIRYASNHYD